jgi:asparagine synthase (glutamine-hydrolysing)
MCGIAGKLYFDRERHVDPSLLHAMNRVLAHRGPDDSGIFHDGAIGLAHRRLSIIDLSPGGHQPMASADGTLWITYNGEVYNFRELRQELEAHGVRFRSQSDTEVILALWQREGVACVERLNGMFAFALWDARRRRLTLVRDRVGKKPLHYYVDGEKALFASEPKGIFVDPEVPAEADLDAIHRYLTFGYVPAPRSAFRGVRKVPPAHYVEIGEDGVRVARYWRLRYRPTRHLSEADACAELVARLRVAVQRRLVSDVPLGAFLSGGVDSSTVVALMSGLTDRPVKTFSIGFEEERYNELPYARLLAARYGTDHHEFVVKPDAVAVLPEIVWHYNEPFADSSAIPTYYLAELARRHVTVALNGDAGDENFAGYQRYRIHQLTSRWDRLPGLLAWGIGVGVRTLPADGDPTRLLRRIQNFWADKHVEARRRYGRWMTILPEVVKQEVYSSEFRAAVEGVDPMDDLLRAYALADTPDLLDATLAADVATYLPDDLLVKVDIASMAHGLEARSPFIDHEFMEFAATLPSSLKLRGAEKKYIFKRAVRDLVPAAVLDRPKQGFGVPISAWLRGPLRELVHDTLFSRASRARGLFDVRALERMVHDHDHHPAVGDRHVQLWALLMLELWYARFIDRAPRAAEVLAS